MSDESGFIYDTLTDQLEDIQNFIDCYDLDNEVYPKFLSIKKNLKSLLKYYSKE